MMRPLAANDFREWSEVRRRNHDWLTVWEPSRQPHHADPVLDRGAFTSRCLQRDRLSRLQRLMIGWGRLAESEDDELCYAYYAANAPDGAPYDRKQAMRSYARRAYAVYRPAHVRRAIAMVLKAIGLEPQGRLNALLTQVGLWFLRSRISKYAAQGA